MKSALPDTFQAGLLCHIVTPVGMLGYGFDEKELEFGLNLARQRDSSIPTAIILDSGSTDSGPSKLALGTMTCPRSSYTRDLRALIKAVQAYRVPLLLSSAGGDGTDAHVCEFVDIVNEILDSEKQAKLKVLSVYSNISPDLVLDRLASHNIAGCGPFVPELTTEQINDTRTIVAQMGPEPFIHAMAAHPDFDILIGGRAYDPSPYIAFSAFCYTQRVVRPLLSLDPHVLGGFAHMGKIMECGGTCATPKSKSSMATVYLDGTFDVRPLEEGAVCVPSSVAAHTLYEKSRPDKLPGPGGYLDLTQATYTSLADKISVRVTGSVFCPSCDTNDDSGDPCYTVKLEGARKTGYRTLFMGSFTDPILIPQLSALLDRVKEYVRQQHRDVDIRKWQLDFHVYDGHDYRYGGKQNPKLGPIVPDAAEVVFIVGEALAESQALATSVASTARIACVHAPYKGQKANSGNFGMGIGGKLEIETGPCAEFSIYHLMDLEHGEEGAAELQGDKGSDTPGLPLFKWLMSWAGAGTWLARPVLGNNSAPPASPLLDTRESTSKDENGSKDIHDPILNGTQTYALGDVASIIRSKNSGPYEITLDVLFDNESMYERVKATGVLTPDCITRLYGIPVESIVYCGFFDQALAFKATIPRMYNGQHAVSGGFMETDVHGSQNYKPLLGLLLYNL